MPTFPVYQDADRIDVTKEYREPYEETQKKYNDLVLTSSGIDYNEHWSTNETFAEYFNSDEQTTRLSLKGRKGSQTLYLSGAEGDLLRRADSSSHKTSSCIYCQTKLVSDKRFGGNRSINVDGYKYILREGILICESCGWWIHSSYVNFSVSARRNGWQRNENYWRYAYGKLEEYDVSDKEVPVNALRNWLAKHPDNVVHSNPFVFEKLMVDCFKDYFGDVEVIHIGGRKDKGIDMKLVRNESDVTLVQVKRRSNIKKTESVSVVRELNGVLLREGVTKGIVVTTANKYSSDAVDESVSKPESLCRYSVELLAFDDVVELLNCGEKEGKSSWYETTQNLDTMPYRRKIINAHPSYDWSGW